MAASPIDDDVGPFPSSARRASGKGTNQSENPMATPLVLPCGLTLPNRLVKVAMAECLSGFGGGPPTEGHSRLYGLWARGGWGLVISGNVQISPDFLATPWDLALPRTVPSNPGQSYPALQPWSTLARSAHPKSSSTPFIVQLSHPGRQSPLFCRPFPALDGSDKPPIGASAVRLGSDAVNEGGLVSWLFHRLLFATPRALSDEEVERLLQRFGEAASFLEGAGVDGVEIHGAHGYLISQFLSPLSNLRPSSSLFSLHHPSARRLPLLRHVLIAIRTRTRPGFCAGIKLSCGDFVPGGLSAEQALEQVRAVCEMRVPVDRDGKKTMEGWDFIEISGGGYSNPVFASSSGPNTSFSDFTTSLLALASRSCSSSYPAILLSSSLRTVPSLQAALTGRSADLLGFGRPSLLHPSLPLTHFLATPSPHSIPPHSIPNFDIWSSLFSLGGRIRLVGAGLGTIWWTWQMARIARGRDVDPGMGIPTGLVGSLTGGGGLPLLVLVVLAMRVVMWWMDWL